ncbi:hypothetical protein MKZ38_004820 [Zalerion maritima]|uniref:Uncharacterized protein n=1 Tax=Zalerion maritima TaxID=339359 RepID=A0AAD5RLF6_9PEZI|nr:hypothetical protein MKZ38_004820 [Zalerion maritima]
MRIPTITQSWAATALLLSLPFASAGPYPRDALHNAGFGYLMARDCVTYCGANNEVCCETNQICTTISANPTCVWGQVAVDVYTTTWTETQVYTRTVSSTYELVTTEAVVEQCVPPDGSGQTACGSVCCASTQTCAWEGQCMVRSSGLGVSSSYAVTTTINGVLTTQYSQPYKPTSDTTTTTTVGATATGTTVAVTDDDDGLSGGAIAGIVIGVIAGVILLLLLCACCVVKGAWSTFMGMFGKKDHHHDREKIVIDEERYVRHGSASHSRRNGHGSWYGDRPSAAASRKKEGGKGLMGMAAGLGTLALILGLKRHDDHKSKPARSRSSYSSSYFTDSYTGSSPSSASTRRTRQTRGSRATRRTRSSRRSSRR